jgi:Na+/H+-dicarboxylate symporter
LLLGGIIGVTLRSIYSSEELTSSYFYELISIIGSWCIRLLKLLVVPMIISVIVSSFAKKKSDSSAGNIITLAFLIFTFTSTIGAVISFVVADLSVHTWEGHELPIDEEANAKYDLSNHDAKFDLASLMPSNIFAVLTEGNIIKLMVLAFLIAWAIRHTTSPYGDYARKIFETIYEVSFSLLNRIFFVLPIAVFTLMMKVFMTIGFDETITLVIKYVVLYVVAILAHMALVYGLGTLLIGCNVLSFFKKIGVPMATAFATQSSIATLPVTIDTQVKKFGVPKSVASSITSLGVTVNMDGAVLAYGIKVTMVAALMGIDLSLGQKILVVLAGVGLSIGGPALPGANVAIQIAILQAAGLPMDAVGFFIVLSALTDPFTTVTNVAGDNFTCLTVSRIKGVITGCNNHEKSSQNQTNVKEATKAEITNHANNNKPNRN